MLSSVMLNLDQNKSQVKKQEHENFSEAATAPAMPPQETGGCGSTHPAETSNLPLDGGGRALV